MFILVKLKISKKEIEEVQKRKREKVGSFDDKIYTHNITADESSECTKYHRQYPAKYPEIFLRENVEIKNILQITLPNVLLDFESSYLGTRKDLFEKYREENIQGIRETYFIFMDGICAGYATLVFKSNYHIFYEKNIPEIVDLNIISHFQRKGLGHQLLNNSLKSIKTSKEIIAETKSWNIASIKLFKKNNFKVYKEDDNNYYLKYN